MTKNDVIGLKEGTYTHTMFCNPKDQTLVCEKHNNSLFGGKLPSKKVSRGAACFYCKKEKGTWP